MEHDLLARGLVIRLETIGRRSGSPRSVTIGFLEQDQGVLLVAASSDATHWAANLLAQPTCSVTLGRERREYRAVPLDEAQRAAAVSGLILKYGTPAERLGGGPAFRLEPSR
jgi:deazaflavin-dependent oxidoreductase (nitroreductase family)